MSRVNIGFEVCWERFDEMDVSMCYVSTYEWGKLVGIFNMIINLMYCTYMWYTEALI